MIEVRGVLLASADRIEGWIADRSARLYADRSWGPMVRGAGRTLLIGMGVLIFVNL